MPFKIYLNSYEDLITSKEETRTGFINFALEKNKRSTPYVQAAKSFKHLASKAENPYELLNMQDIQLPLLTAAGLSDKALGHLTEPDKKQAILELIKNFLEPAGKYFVDEAVYRYLLFKGDSLGGSMRNLVGSLAEQKLIRTLLSNMTVMGIEYYWLSNITTKPEWIRGNGDDYDLLNSLKAIHWLYENKNHLLIFNLKIPAVKNNIDICLFDLTVSEYSRCKDISYTNKIIMLGELKGGIDPAGADEHWKTANSALKRIKDSFSNTGLDIKTSFIGAAIEKNMAKEIYSQLVTNQLTNAANLTRTNQLIEFCNWIIKL